MNFPEREPCSPCGKIGSVRSIKPNVGEGRTCECQAVKMKGDARFQPRWVLMRWKNGHASRQDSSFVAASVHTTVRDDEASASI